jgi:hypothetical protein
MRAALPSFPVTISRRDRRMRSAGALGVALLRLFCPGTAPWEPPWATIGAGIAAALAAAMAAAIAATPACAAPPPPPPASVSAAGGAIQAAPIAVMGLSLAMTAHQVLAVLRPQALALQTRAHPCAGAPAARCIDLVRARMPDGSLEVRFVEAPPGGPGRSLAWRVRLTIAAHGDPQGIQAAAAADYGPPTEPAHQLWCPGVTRGTVCPADQPRLRLAHGPNGASVLSLSDPGLRARLAHG